MPVYSITLANILNDFIDGGGYRSDELIQFTAPDVRILIVDDISTNLKVAVELLAPYQMKIDTCMSGNSAVDLVKENALHGIKYDLVFMDHMMPGMDGIEASSRIKTIEKNAYYQDLPVIMFTANAISGQREAFLQKGIDDFLAKPIEMQKLAAIMEKWIPPEKRIEITGIKESTDKKQKQLKEIPGVNIEEGLKNSGGSLEAYTNILSVFYRDVTERVEKIIQAEVAVDLDNYTILVHALKSASRSIGAAGLGDMAAELEDAGLSRNLSLIAQKTSIFLEELQTLAKNVSAALQEYTAAAEGAEIAALPITKLEWLKEALFDMDVEMVDTLLKELLNMPLDSQAKTFIIEIEQHILLFEYEKAIAQINVFLLSEYEKSITQFDTFL